MAPLHAFMKKTERTPLRELELVRERRNLWLGG
jgi:phage-related protein